MNDFLKNLLTLLIGILISVFVSSCEVVGGIFKAGMGFGIFMVVVVIAIIVLIIRNVTKK